jgi:hypothetical protein
MFRRAEPVRVERRLGGRLGGRLTLAEVDALRRRLALRIFGRRHRVLRVPRFVAFDSNRQGRATGRPSEHT